MIDLITGSTGFVASHLLGYLLRKGHIVYGTKRMRSDLGNIQDEMKLLSEDQKNRFKLIECDLDDYINVRNMLEEVQPDRIFHLAAQSHAGDSFKKPIKTVETNSTMQLNVLEAVRELKLDSKVLCCGSSEEYGKVYENELPILESQPLRPLSPYAVSKITQDYLGLQYFESYGVKTIRTRAFNHSAARRGSRFCLSAFSIRLIEAKKKRQDFIKVGNLESSRDFSHVKDIIRAYDMLLDKGEYGKVYNICSEKTYKLKDIVEILLRISGNEKIKLIQDEKYMRPSDVPILLGNCDKLKEKTGWKAEYNIEDIVRDVYQYWEGKINV